MATKVASTAKTAAKKTSVSAPAKAGARPTDKAGSKVFEKQPAASKSASAPVTRKSVASKPVDEPSMRFYHSRALRDKTYTVLDEIEASPGHPRHGDSMADLVAGLIEAGMDYYFMRALKQAKVGFVVEQSARMGMSGAIKLISSVNRKFIVRMDKDQLLVVAQHIRELC